ncbi:MAG TPA: cellulase family glycosylhydrolase, partial [Polyangiaceae bacterium]|nr:cellulase family glycosylhydrolase [Polyangiaceae bacterium]
QCWRDGCMAFVPGASDAGPPPTYAAAGMQSLVDAVRAAEGGGSHHVLVLGGLEYSNALTQWLAFEPADPAGNLAASWHVYSNNACRSASCWNAAPAQVAAAVPLVATEIGENDCAAGFITPLMQWLDGKGAGYLAWSWNAFGACAPARSPWSLVTDYTSGDPNGAYAQAFHDHVVGL